MEIRGLLNEKTLSKSNRVYAMAYTRIPLFNFKFFRILNDAVYILQRVFI